MVCTNESSAGSISLTMILPVPEYTRPSRVMLSEMLSASAACAVVVFTTRSPAVAMSFSTGTSCAPLLPNSSCAAATRSVGETMLAMAFATSCITEPLSRRLPLVSLIETPSAWKTAC